MKLSALAPLLVFLALCLLFAVGLTKDPTAIDSQMIDRPVPAFQLSELYDEERVITQDTLKGEVTLVNVFGSWCAACVVEHPQLVAIAQTQKVRIIGVDWRDTRSKAKAWLLRHSDPYAFVIFDDLSQLAIGLGVAGAPESFIVDKAGKIRYKHTGVIRPQDWHETLLPMIEELEAQ